MYASTGKQPQEIQFHIFSIYHRGAKLVIAQPSLAIPNRKAVETKNWQQELIISIYMIPLTLLEPHRRAGQEKKGHYFL